MKRLIAAVIITALLVGCSRPLTPDNSVTVVADSKHSSERAFRNLLRVMKECYPDSLTIRANFYPEAKEGELDVFQVNDFGNIPVGTWYVAPKGSGSSVKLVRFKRAHSRLDTVLPEWIEGDSTNCPNGTRFEPRPPGSELNQNNMPVR